jgi:hypothetical protein
MLCPGQRDTHSVGYFEESDLSLVIRTDEGEQDDFIFFALIVVHVDHSNFGHAFKVHAILLNHRFNPQ